LVKEKGHPEEIKYNLSLAKNKYGETALHMAAEDSVAVLEKIWAFFLKKPSLTLRRRIKSHLLFAGIIRSSPFSPR